MKKLLKIILPLVVLALGLAGLGLFIKFRKEAKPRPAEVLPPLVDTKTVRLQNYQFRIRTQGTVIPRTQIQLAAEVSGRIQSTSSSLDAGGFFEEEEVLLTIDPRDFELAVVQAKARVEEATYRLQLEEAEAIVAREEWEQLGQGDPNPLLLRQPQVAQAKAALAAAEAALEQAQRDLSRCRVRAPFAGRVGEKFVDVGQFVSKGAPLARIYAVDFAEVRLPLAPDQLAYVNLPLDYRGESRLGTGPAVLLKASLAGQNHGWEGSIHRVEGEIDVRTRMLFAVARVADPYGRTKASGRPPLAAGLFVEAEILGKQATNVVVLPRKALYGKSNVLVVDEQNLLHVRPVEIWRADRQEVVVRSGLQPGDRVCLSKLDAVQDGMAVRVVGAASTGPKSPSAPRRERGDE